MADCLVGLGSNPDLFITQGVDFAWTVCLTSPPLDLDGAEIACIEKNKITMVSPTCLVVGDRFKMLCNPDCALKIEGEYEITAIASDGKVLTVSPDLPGVTVKKCYTQEAVSVSEGCLGGAAATTSAAPRIVGVQTKWNMFGSLSYDLDSGAIRTGGVNTQAGSKRVTSTLFTLFEPGMHINIPAAGIVDATIISVSDSVDQQSGTPIQIATLDQAATQTTCAAASIAEGLLLNFKIKADGSCLRAMVPASQTRSLRPRPQSEAPADCHNPSSFLGYYFLGAQQILADGTVETFEISSGCAYLRQTAVAATRLLTE